MRKSRSVSFSAIFLLAVSACSTQPTGSQVELSDKTANEDLKTVSLTAFKLAESLRDRLLKDGVGTTEIRWKDSGWTFTYEAALISPHFSISDWISANSSDPGCHAHSQDGITGTSHCSGWGEAEDERERMENGGYITSDLYWNIEEQMWAFDWEKPLVPTPDP